MLPPEITSALTHSGPGAGSMIAASTVWHQLGAELEDSARGYASVLTSVTDAWHGLSSAAMVTAAEPFVAWLGLAAQQCQLIGSSMQTVIAAFELTHFTVVHPALVAANRARLALLLATNFFGINLPAIAETEAEYHAMWVNNSAAMYRYAATSASAVVPSQFSPPPPIANPAGLLAQAEVVPGTATAGSAARTAAAVPLAAQSLTAFDPSKGWFGYFSTWANQGIAAGGFPVNMLAVLAQLSTAHGFQSLGGDIGAGLSQSAADFAGIKTRLAGALGAAGPSWAPTGSVGTGILVGTLTAPPSVVGLLPASDSPVQLASAASALAPKPPVTPLAMPPLGASPAASSGDRRRTGRDYDDIELGKELLGTVMQRPPSAG